mmetsp:Transcript_992/g.3034  ORF Transcript_992/g.3034 Transcript_992/m.3034 type:complete len:360 (-) Transcript_992:11-1090(-)
MASRPGASRTQRRAAAAAAASAAAYEAVASLPDLQARFFPPPSTTARSRRTSAARQAPDSATALLHSAAARYYHAWPSIARWLTVAGASDAQHAELVARQRRKRQRVPGPPDVTRFGGVVDAAALGAACSTPAYSMIAVAKDAAESVGPTRVYVGPRDGYKLALMGTEAAEGGKDRVRAVLASERTVEPAPPAPASAWASAFVDSLPTAEVNRLRALATELRNADHPQTTLRQLTQSWLDSHPAAAAAVAADAEEEEEVVAPLSDSDVRWLIAAGFDARSLASRVPPRQQDEVASTAALTSDLLDAVLLRSSGVTPEHPAALATLSSATERLAERLADVPPKDLVTPEQAQQLRKHLSA